MARYAELCAWTLARAHARSGDRIAIAAYLGSSKTADEAFADLRVRATPTAPSRTTPCSLDAIATGRLEAVHGV